MLGCTCKKPEVRDTLLGLREVLPADTSAQVEARRREVPGEGNVRRTQKRTYERKNQFSAFARTSIPKPA